MSIITKSDYKSVLEKMTDNVLEFKEKYLSRWSNLRRLTNTRWTRVHCLVYVCRNATYYVTWCGIPNTKKGAVKCSFFLIK